MRRSKKPAQRTASGNGILVSEKQKIESLVNSGLIDQARKTAERLCSRHRNNPEAWFLLGAVCGAQGDYARAIECCRRTTQLAPDVAIGHFNLGVALHRAGRAQEAVVALGKALELQPRDTAAWFALGNLYEKQNELAEAERCYRRLLDIDPYCLSARMNLGSVLKLRGEIDAAEQCYRDALKAVPDNADVIYNLGVLYQSSHRYADAEMRYRQVLDIEPEHGPSLNNLGLVLIPQSRLDEAVEIFTPLLQIRAGDPDTRRNLSAVYKEQNRLDLAEEQLKAILSVDPENIAARQDRSLVWLQQGEFAKGWDEYEWRSAGRDISARWPFPVWDGVASADTTILVFPEQGLGDEIMFASCITDLSAAIGRVVLACDERLEKLLQRSFPAATVLGRKAEQDVTWLDRLPHVDAQISIASLPKLFRRHRDDFRSAENGYLTADPAAVQKWRSRYAALGTGLKVGISWRGGHLSNTLLKRSIPLEKWTEILCLPGVHFVNLQYGDCAAELGAMQQSCGIHIHDWADSNPIADMDDFSAKVRALDLVVSIDNSTVHLAGALGVSVWILQPFSPDWRWMTAQAGSYWYSSVRQYKQAAPGHWGDVLAQVAHELKMLAGRVENMNG